MNTEEQQILNIKVRYEDAIQGIVKYKEKLEALSQAQSKLMSEYREGKVSHEEYKMTMSAISEQMKSHKTTIRELSKEVQNNIKTEREQEGSLRALRAELSNATKEFDALSKAEREGAKGKELKKHINEITDELKSAEAETQRFYRNVGNYEESIKNALGVNSEFANSIMKMAEGGRGMSGILEGAKTSVKAFGSTLMGLMSNPVFLALAGIAGVGVTFKWFYDYNKGLEESTRLTREFLGLTGDSLKSVRDGIQATADTYGKDFKETLEAVDVLTSQYGYDAEESLRIINDGFQSGADLNGDMISKIKQFAPAFHDASISGRELVATIQQTRSGIFSDSGMALIQMGSKKIREMSSATVSALDGIGISSKQVQADLESGSKSTFDIIKMISARLRELPQNSQEVGAVLKDVFGKQGANAGLKMIEQLDTMVIDLDKLKETTGEYGETLNAQRAASEELNKTLSAMFEIGGRGFEELTMEAKTLAMQGLTRLLKGVIDVINYFRSLYNESMVLRTGVQAVVANFKMLGSAIRLAFSLVVEAVKSAGRSMKGFAEIVEGIVTLSFDKIKSGFSQISGGFVKSVKSGLSDVRTFARSAVTNSVDAINNVVRNKKINPIVIPAHVPKAGSVSGAMSAFKRGPAGGGHSAVGGAKSRSVGGSVGRSSSVVDSMKHEEEAIRKAEELMQQLAEQTEEQRRKSIEAQYDREIEGIKKRLSEEKGLTVKAREALNAQMVALENIKGKKLLELDGQLFSERVKEEQSYIQNMLASVEKGSKEELRLKLKGIEDARLLELAEIEKKVNTAEEKNRLVAAVNAKYRKEEEEAEKAHRAAMIASQTAAIKGRFEEKIMDVKANGDGGSGERLEVLRLELEQRKAMLDEAYRLEGESEEQFHMRQLELMKDVKDKTEECTKAEISVITEKAKMMEGVIGSAAAVAESFGERSKGLTAAAKVLALAEIAINSGAAIASGIRSAAAVPFPANLAAIATTVATILTTIATATKTVKSAKFARGGLVSGAGSDTSDSIDAKLSNGESVLTASATRMFAPALSAFNQIGGGVPIIGTNHGGQQMGEEFLARAVARGMASAPPPVVSVEEINRVGNRIKVLERISTVK